MSKQEKYGFVYIWYDRKRKMYYIGSHWGHKEDGYICSSNRMRDAYRRRPEDFKRKILEITENRNILLQMEDRWLKRVKRKNVYYNLNFITSDNVWWNNEENKKSIGEKIGKKVSTALKGRPLSEEHKKKLSESKKGKPKSEEHKQKLREANLGKISSDETKAKISAYNKEKRNYDDPVFKDKMSEAAKNRSEETRKKISENSRNLQVYGKIGMKNKKHSEETKLKMAVAAKNRINKIKH